MAELSPLTPLAAHPEKHLMNPVIRIQFRMKSDPDLISGTHRNDPVLHYGKNLCPGTALLLLSAAIPDCRIC